MRIFLKDPVAYALPWQHLDAHTSTHAHTYTRPPTNIHERIYTESITKQEYATNEHAKKQATRQQRPKQPQ